MVCVPFVLNVLQIKVNNSKENTIKSIDKDLLQKVCVVFVLNALQIKVNNSKENSKYICHLLIR
jgi:hypothetical protein